MTAQNKTITSRTCGTVEHREQLQLKFPAQYSAGDEFERWIAEKQLEMQANKTLAGEATIPVVVHVIHDGDAIGINENISEAQVISQMQALNEDFGKMRGSRGHNTHFDGADARIEWCLAQTDPNGNPTNGINRVDMGQAEWLPNDIDATVKPNTIWDPTQYCNIWVLNLGDGLLGYAQFPNGSGLPGTPGGIGPADTDGIVVLATAFGTADADDGSFYLAPPYNLGRTLTHEAGHWLGLLHIWGDANCGDDFCNDTPTQMGPSNGCPTTTTCDGQADMVENYMDYSVDGCMNIFTFNQKSRMTTVLANSPRRMELTTSNKCSAPSEILFVDNSLATMEESDVLVGCNGYKDYTVEMRITAEPSADAIINFTPTGTATMGTGADYTIIPSSITFPNNSASIRSFTLRIFDDAYVEGTEIIDINYNITTAGDAVAGSWNQTFQVTLQDNDINPDQGGVLSDFFSEDFAGGLPSSWELNDLANGGDWEYSTTPPSSWSNGPFGFDTEGNGYIMFNSDGKGGDGEPENAEIIMAPINCSGVFGTKLKFQQVFCKYQNDQTSIGISTDGTNYTFITQNSGFSQNQCTTPRPGMEEIDISAIADNQPTVYIKFKYQGDYDYWWIIDDIALNGRGAAPVQASVNTPAPQEHYLGPNGRINFYDPTSGDIMMAIENLTSFDYGCTTVEVHRSGNSSSEAWNPDPAEFITDKTFRVTPTNNNPTGSYKIFLYYLDTEVAGWEAATGRTSIDLNVIKTINDITNPQASDTREYALDLEDDYYGDFIYSATFFTGFSDFSVGPQDAVLLPFTLAYFDGNKERDGIQLKWRSEREGESDQYELQRSIDGIVFKTIATLDAVGGNNPANYDYLDRDFNYGQNYYRLKHIKLDGDIGFSHIVSVKVATIPEEVHLFPNPVKGNARLRVNSAVEETGVRLKVLNTLGQVMKEIPVSLEVGDNYFDLNVADLSTGVFFLQIDGGEKDKTTYRFVKY